MIFRYLNSMMQTASKQNRLQMFFALSKILTFLLKSMSCIPGQAVLI